MLSDLSRSYYPSLPLCLASPPARIPVAKKPLPQKRLLPLRVPMHKPSPSIPLPLPTNGEDHTLHLRPRKAQSLRMAASSRSLSVIPTPGTESSAPRPKPAICSTMRYTRETLSGVNVIQGNNAHEISLEVDMDKQGIKEFLNSLNESVSFTDISIKELPMELIIKRIYSE